MRTILVVEDYPDNMALVEEILEDEGFKVLQAETAEDGIRSLFTNKVDLILMDVSLPGMNGLEATKIIKANPDLKQIPVVALTAHAMQTDKEAAHEAGCDDFLTKPVDEDLLLDKIRAILNVENAHE